MKTSVLPHCGNDEAQAKSLHKLLHLRSEHIPSEGSRGNVDKCQLAALALAKANIQHNQQCAGSAHWH
jgi:hypothetical protein